MNSRRARVYLVLISLFVWAHLIPAVLAMPWLYPEESQLEEKFSFSTEMYGSQINEGRNVGQFEEDLISETVARWVMNSALFILGLYSCWKIAFNARSWPVWVLVLSGSVCLISIPPLVQIIFFHFSPWDHFGWLIGYISERLSSADQIFKTYSFVINLYLIPILYLGLFLYAAIELLCRIKNRGKAA